VVTFLPRPGDPTLVTHRVVRVDRSGDGPRLVTKGDANNAVDPWRVGPKQLRGVVQYHVPWAGYLAQWLNRDQKRAGVLVVASLLILYAVWQVIAAVRERRARGSSS
jgi:signal peptidase